MIASSSAVLLSPVCVGYTEVPVIFSNRLSLIKLPILSFLKVLMATEGQNGTASREFGMRDAEHVARR